MPDVQKHASDAAHESVLEGYLERTSKFRKSWARRYVAFCVASRKMEYAWEKTTPVKGTIICTNITRIAELHNIVDGDGDCYAVVVDGLKENGALDKWTIRMPDAASFDVWYGAIRTSLAKASLMPAVDYDLPPADPRNNLTFINVPNEHLHVFLLLEKAIMYYFGVATMQNHELAPAATHHYFVIGDRNIYVFFPNADVVRCIPIIQISALYGPSDNDKPGFIAVKVAPHQHDLILCINTDGKKIVDTIAAVYKGMVNRSLNCDSSFAPSTATMNEFIKKKEFNLQPSSNYKLVPLSPTPKSKLKIALDQYQKENGVSYVKGQGKTGSHRTKQTSRSRSRSHSRSKCKNPEDSLSRLLARLSLEKYIPILRKQYADIDLISCMDETDLGTFGITDTDHCKAIIAAAKKREEEGTPQDDNLDPPSASVDEGSSRKPTISLDDDLDDDLDVSPTKPHMIMLDSDDEDLLPIKREPSSSPEITPPTTAVLLDDSDDDLVVAPPKGVTLDSDSDSDL